MSEAVVLAELIQRIERINAEAVGRSGDDLEFRVSRPAGAVDVHFRDGGTFVARVPVHCVELAILEAISRAVSCGEMIGRATGKREIGDFLRRECGL